MAKKTPPKKVSAVTKRENYDRDKIREEFLQSPFMDWVRYAEKKGWDPLTSRREFPVKTWQEEKRRILAEKQLDILSGLIYERRFKWTNQIIETLDAYPKSIDAAKSLADAKMWQISKMFEDYKVWFEAGHGKPDEKGRRKVHPFERVSMTEISMLMKGMKDIVDAKLKALMLDKWAITKLDIPNSEIESGGVTEAGVDNAHRITIEGRGEFKYDQLQSWFDEFHDPQKDPDPEEKK